jgi:hypothetical protein
MTYPLAGGSVSLTVGAFVVNSYRFYLKNRENVVVGSGAFDAEDHDTAIRIARVRSTTSPNLCHSYELLQDSNVIHCEILLPPPETQTHG